MLYLPVFLINRSQYILFAAFSLLLALQLPSYTALSQTPADSLLPEVTVTATAYGNRSEEVAASVATLNSKAFETYGEATPLYGLNTLAGVQFQERAPGSYRLAIRGSALRAPFGVRNVKVYLNGLPFTEASGITPLNLLDVALYRQVSVVKGPAASYYGAGTGGVLAIESLDPQGTAGGWEGEVAGGSYNYWRGHSGYTHSDSLQQWRLGVTSLRTDGYRVQSELQRTNLFWTGRHTLTPTQQLETTLLLARTDYGIPGGLTAEQFAENPRQARPPGFVLGSEEADAGVKHTYGLVGLGYHWQPAAGLHNTTYAWGNTSFYDHPFNTDYKRIQSSGGGLRQLSRWRWGRWQLQAGGEYQLQFETTRNYGNRGGQPDTLNFSDEATNQTALLFTQAQVALGSSWQLTGGLSYNWYQYDLYRLEDFRPVAPATVPYRLTKNFEPVLAPRLALLKELGEQWQLWIQASRGFSPPTGEEVLTNDGVFNAGLEAEQGINYELGTRFTGFSGRITWEASVYHQRLSQTITSYTDGSSQVVRFQNLGSARQWGVESQLAALLWQGKQYNLQLTSALAWQRYRFNRFQVRENDFSGREVPGVPRWTATHQLVWGAARGLGFSLSHFYQSKMPLNNINDVYSEAQNVVNAQLSYRFGLSARSPIQVFVSAQNLLNERYSLGYDLNPFGQRYFQPAPERNWVVGVRL